MDDIFGTPASPPPRADSQPPPSRPSMSLGDIFGDAGGGAPSPAPPDDGGRRAHHFHGEDSVIAEASPSAIEFVRGGAAPGDVRYQIRKRSGRVIGPLPTSEILAMFGRGELLGSEEASVDGVNWRPMAQISEFAQAIQAAMASALSGLEDLPAAKGSDDDLTNKGGRGGFAGLGALFGESSSAAAPDMPPSLDDATSQVGGTDPISGEMSVDTKALREAERAKSTVERRRQIRTTKLFRAATVGIVLLLVVAAGVAVNFITPYGYFGIKFLFPAAPVEVAKPKPVEELPPPTLPAVDQDSGVLLKQDSYLAYRQGAEQAARSVEAGKAVTPFPDAAKKAAAQQARFLAYLVHLEDMPVFLPKLREALAYADGDELGKAVGEAASAYADQKWDTGLAVLKPLTEPAKNLAPHERAEAWTWMGIGQRGKGDLEGAGASFDNALQATTKSRVALFLQAQVLAESGAPDGAREYLEKLLADAPEHPRGRILLGKLLVAKSETRDQGAKMLIEMSEGKGGESASPPLRATAWMARVDVALAARQYADALRYVSKAVELVPTNRKIRLLAADTALRLRDYNIAKGNGQKLLELNAEDIDGTIIVARANLGSRDTLRAYSDLQAAVKKWPDNVVVNHWFGMAAREMSKLDESRTQFEKATKLDPSRADSVVELAYDLIAQGRLSDAVKRSSEAESKVNAGDRSKVRAAKAYAYARRRQFDQAEKEFRKALEESPGDTDTRARLATMLVAKRDLEAAERELNEAQTTDSKNPAVIVAAGDVLAARRDYRGALGRYEEAMQLAPNSYEPYLHAARAAVELKDFGRAKGFVETAGQLRPGISDVLATQGVVLKAQDPKQSARLLTQAMEQAPEEPQYPFELGMVFVSMGAPVEAVDAFRKAVSLDPNFVDAYYNLAKVQRDLVRPRDAKASLDDAVRIDPKRSDAWLEMADLLGQQGDDQGALRAYEKALTADPKNPASICNMGETLILRMGNDNANLKRGVEILERCVKLAPTHPSAWMNLGNAYKTIGKKKDAVRCYKQHLIVHPGDSTENSIVEDNLADLEGRSR